MQRLQLFLLFLGLFVHTGHQDTPILVNPDQELLVLIVSELHGFEEIGPAVADMNPAYSCRREAPVPIGPRSA